MRCGVTLPVDNENAVRAGSGTIVADELPLASAARLGGGLAGGGAVEIRLTLAAHGKAVDVVVAAPDGATVGAVAGVLVAASGVDGPVTLSVGGRALAPDDVVGVAPLLDGVRVECGPSGGPLGLAGGSAGAPYGVPGPRQLRVVGGPDAGGVQTLRGGPVVVGRGVGADVPLADVGVSRAHAVIDARPDGVWVRDAGSANGTWLDGVEIGAEPVPLPAGSMVRCGDSLLTYTPPTDPPAVVRADSVGGLELHRPPRLRPRRAAVEVTFPAPPPEPPRLRFPWVLVLAPLVVGGVLWLVTGGNSGYLLLTLLSPLLFCANAISDRVTGQREHRRAVATHVAAVRRAQVELDAALAAETVGRRAEAPDPAAVIRPATTAAAVPIRTSSPPYAPATALLATSTRRR